jgi:3-dehydroquinate synthase
MSVHLQRVSVAFTYPVHFTWDVFCPDNPDLVDAISAKEPLRRHRVLAVVDRGVALARPSLPADIMGYARRHADRMELVLPPLVIEGGEAAKNDPAGVAALHDALHAQRIDRQSFVLLVGGGALLDMGGFAAATAHRGVRVIRVPTTVLAQADSGVGVKNGINAFGKKNFLGTFAPPFAVLNDARFLMTLSPRDRTSGMAEAVKVALLRDAAFFRWIEEHAADLAAGEPARLAELVRRTAALHLCHIATAGDPFELGSARPLDFGHWAAHKLESMTSGRLRHGEAVAIGIAIDTHYAALRGYCDRALPETVSQVLRSLGFPLWDEALGIDAEAGRPAVLDGLGEFREHLGGELTITLLKGIGQSIEVHDIDEPVMTDAIHALARAEIGT